MYSQRDRAVAFLMLMPSIALIGIFVYGFILQTINTSLLDWGTNPIANPPLSANVVKSYVGGANYSAIMTDLLEFSFRNSLVNTFFFTLFFVGGCVLVGLFLALLLDQKIVGEAFFRTVFLFPMSLSFVVTGTIWRWMLQPGGGINILPTFIPTLEPIMFKWMSSRQTWLGFEWAQVPTFLTYVGLAILAFLAVNYALSGKRSPLIYVIVAAVVLLTVWLAGWWDYVWLPLDTPEAEPSIAPKGFNAALIGVIIAAVWQMSGYTMAMFLAGIRGVPEEMREAARVDGCSTFGVYRHVVLPQLNPIILSAMIVLGHISLKIFDLVFAMAGPDNAQTIVPGILVYTEGFRENAFSKASSIAMIMLSLVAVIIVPYLWTQLRDEK